MGGMVAQHVALAAPGRLRSLTLVVTHTGGPLAWLPGRRGLRGLATAWSRDPNRRARGLATMLYPDRFVTGLSAEAFTDAMRDRTEYEPPQRTVLRQMRAVRRHDTRRQLCNIKAPTLVIKAGRDVLVRPAHSDKLAAAIPGASLLCYRDAGHGVLYQRARELNQAVLEHLAAADQRIAARSTP